jgi:signal transduction histidine kinase
MIDLARVPPELLPPILAGNLRQVGPARKLIAHFLEAVALRLAADACWLTRAGQGERLLPGGRLLSGDPGLCDEPLAIAFLRREHPAIPATVVLSPLVVHGSAIAVVGAARRQGDFGATARRVLERLGGVLAEELARREEERTTRVLDRIREKIASELRPRDLAYQILDGLHQLVKYDHSSAFLAYDRERGAFRIEAEKIVWTKAKSPFVGREVRVSPERFARICRAIEIHTLAEGSAGAGLAGAADPPGIGDGFADLLNYHREAGIPPVTSLLSAPLFYGDEFLGILKVAAWQRPPFARRDLEVVERFLPAAAVSMRNAQVNRSLEMQAVEAEVKASLVTLSHAVAHDVNNAVGSILPLAQQMRFDLRHAPLELETLDRDLGVIIDNARLCRRIFSNMLRVAGSGRASELPVDVAQVVAETMPFLLALAGRRGIEIVLDLAPDLPSASFRRQDLQHIVLNLVRNSLEALAPGAQGGERGGRVEIAARRGEEDSVELSVADDGPGIAAELISKVQEPFFSTRPGGTGLGLAICRALAWQNGGSLVIESPIAAPAETTVGAAGVPAPDGAVGGPFAEPEDEEGTLRAATGAAGTVLATAALATAATASASAGWAAAAGHGGTRVTLRLGAEARHRESW